MNALRFLMITLFAIVCCTPVMAAQAESEPPLVGDALFPPLPVRVTSSSRESPDRYAPSAFLAGRVAVQLVFVESNGEHQTSTEDWTEAQRTSITSHVQSALDWWAARLPEAGVSFDLHVANVTTGYEPITHSLNEEKLWAGEALASLGFAGSNYFEQAYSANESLRREQRTDWATTIFAVDSDTDTDGRFADGQFAYAYVGGPFLVITSDASTYGADRLSPVVAHEFGHIFGALDQYEAAGTPCTVKSGYLGIANTNSQFHGCGTKSPSIMWEPLSAFQSQSVDASALGQIGYHDSDGDTLPDPIDTAPLLNVVISQNSPGRPRLTAHATDQPFPSPLQRSISINTIARVEFRAEGGEWSALPAADGAYNSIDEGVDAPLPLYDGTHTVELRAINRVGAASPVAMQQVVVSGVGTQPTVSITVPGFQNTISTTIDIDAPADFELRISENAAFADAAWQPAQPHHNLTLAPIDSEHILYIALRDPQALEMPIVQRRIVLDRTAPTGDALVESTNQQILVIRAEDIGSGIDMMSIIDSNGANGLWQPFSSTVQLSAYAAPTGVRLRDRAGNISASFTIQHPNTVHIPLTVR